jgi:hypothetical protein
LERQEARDARRFPRDEDDPEFPRDDRQIQTRTLRLDFPHFDGDNPSSWFYKVNQFFDYYQTPQHQRLRMASFHMEGEALVWFQDADEAGQFPTWEAFLQALLTRFGLVYDDPMESLMQLRQTSTMAEYTTQFEALSNRLRGLFDRNRLSCFLSGLKDEVRLPLWMLNPRTLVAAFGLAKLQEEYLSSTRRPVRLYSSYSSTKQLPGSSSSSSSSASPSSVVPIQKLSPVQMKERRDKGLCYNCDEKWNPAHKCKPPKLFLMHGCDSFSEEKLEEVFYEDSLDWGDHTVDPIVTEAADPEISLHAIVGSVSPNTMRLVGSLRNQRVVILLDSGSTHNFLDPTVLRRAPLSVAVGVTLKVRVANGATVESEGLCQSVSLTLQGHSFTTDFYLIPLAGCDVVLGVAWLRTLGPILWDFTLMTMAFEQDRQSIILQGLAPSGFTLEDGASFLRSSPSCNKGFLLHLWSGSPSSFSLTLQASTWASLQLPLQALLAEFESVFTTPQGLPPQRSRDNQIILTDSTPVSVRPYRYPFFQKTEIEKLVTDLLASGVIQPSINPFLSPVLLVRKADGS